MEEKTYCKVLRGRKDLQSSTLEKHLLQSSTGNKRLTKFHNTTKIYGGRKDLQVPQWKRLTTKFYGGRKDWQGSTVEENHSGQMKRNNHNSDNFAILGAM